MLLPTNFCMVLTCFAAFWKGFFTQWFSTGWLFPRFFNGPRFFFSWFEVLRVVGFSGLLPWSCWSFLLQNDHRKSPLCWTGISWSLKRMVDFTVFFHLLFFQKLSSSSLLEWFWHRDFEQQCFWSKILDDAHIIRSVCFQLCHRGPAACSFCQKPWATRRATRQHLEVEVRQANACALALKGINVFFPQEEGSSFLGLPYWKYQKMDPHGFSIGNLFQEKKIQRQVCEM